MKQKRKNIRSISLEKQRRSIVIKEKAIKVASKKNPDLLVKIDAATHAKVKLSFSIQQSAKALKGLYNVECRTHNECIFKEKIIVVEPPIRGNCYKRNIVPLKK